MISAGIASFESCLVMSFEEYLVTKKIDSAAFKAAEPVLWNDWRALFEKVSVVSFTSQKLYQINPTRRKYKLEESAPTSTQPAAAPKPNRPIIKPKMP